MDGWYSPLATCRTHLPRRTCKDLDCPRLRRASTSRAVPTPTRPAAPASASAAMLPPPDDGERPLHRVVLHLGAGLAELLGQPQVFEDELLEKLTGRGLHSLTSELNLRSFGTHLSR